MNMLLLRNLVHYHLTRCAMQHVSATTARYKWLDGGIEFVDAIPKSPSGKILRRLLRERVGAPPAAATARL